MDRINVFSLFLLGLEQLVRSFDDEGLDVGGVLRRQHAGKRHHAALLVHAADNDAHPGLVFYGIHIA